MLGAVNDKLFKTIMNLMQEEQVSWNFKLMLILYTYGSCDKSHCAFWNNGPEITREVPSE